MTRILILKMKATSWCTAWNTQGEIFILNKQYDMVLKKFYYQKIT